MWGGNPGTPSAVQGGWREVRAAPAAIGTEPPPVCRVGHTPPAGLPVPCRAGPCRCSALPCTEGGADEAIGRSAAETRPRRAAATGATRPPAPPGAAGAARASGTMDRLSGKSGRDGTGRHGGETGVPVRGAGGRASFPIPSQPIGCSSPDRCGTLPPGCFRHPPALQKGQLGHKLVPVSFCWSDG